MPRTPAQIEASRRNGAKSRGPVTPEGKARVAGNAIKHGLNSRVVVLSSESPEAFQQLLDKTMREYQPANADEEDLVVDLVASIWRLSRTVCLETTAIDLEIDSQRQDVESRFEKIDPATRTALAISALTAGDGVLRYLSAHEARLRKAIRYARAELQKCKNKPEPPTTEPPRAADLDPAPGLPVEQSGAMSDGSQEAAEGAPASQAAEATTLCPAGRPNPSLGVLTRASNRSNNPRLLHGSRSAYRRRLHVGELCYGRSVPGISPTPGRRVNGSKLPPVPGL